MALIQTQDRALFTATELALLETSLPSVIQDLTPTRLKAQVNRAKRYLDKYRDLTRRQHGATKRGSDTGRVKLSNARTVRKAQLLSDALSRFEKRLEQRERRERHVTGERRAPPRSARPVSATQQDTLGKQKQRRQAAADSASTARITRQFQKSKMRPIQGHISASGKRRQSRRDARR